MGRGRIWGQTLYTNFCLSTCRNSFNLFLGFPSFLIQFYGLATVD